MPIRILAIETSCDETAIAVVHCSGGEKNLSLRVLHNLISSQIAVHSPFGGVVPMLAKREHIKNLPRVLRRLDGDKKLFQRIDAIAVTVGPGLEPALWTGIEFAKKLAEKHKKPFITANHMEGHLYSPWLSRSGETKKIPLPAIVLIVSGGHTILLHLKSLTKLRKLGETRDDAAGEAFDKAAKMMRLPYPGGPIIEAMAKKVSHPSIHFPRPMMYAKGKEKYEFSFSGLKTAALYYLRDTKKADKNDVAASFQEAIIEVLTAKTMNAADEFEAQSILLCGGVAANSVLRETLRGESEKRGLSFFAPAMEFNTDNAAMVAGAAYITSVLKKKKYPITADPNLNV